MSGLPAGKLPNGWCRGSISKLSSAATPSPPILLLNYDRVSSIEERRQAFRYITGFRGLRQHDGRNRADARHYFIERELEAVYETLPTP